MMLGPIEMMRLTVDGMMARGFGRIVNIVSRSVKVPQAELGLSNGARSGLVGFAGGLARQRRPTTSPSTICCRAYSTATPSTATFAACSEAAARHSSRFSANAPQASTAKRYGDPAEFGAFCAFLCSAHAGYHHRPEFTDRRRKLSGRVLVRKGSGCEAYHLGCGGVCGSRVRTERVGARLSGPHRDVIVPFPPGGSVDGVARIIVDQLNESVGRISSSRTAPAAPRAMSAPTWSPRPIRTATRCCSPHRCTSSIRFSTKTCRSTW